MLTSTYAYDYKRGSNTNTLSTKNPKNEGLEVSNRSREELLV